MSSSTTLSKYLRGTAPGARFVCLSPSRVRYKSLLTSARYMNCAVPRSRAAEHEIFPRTYRLNRRVSTSGTLKALSDEIEASAMPREVSWTTHRWTWRNGWTINYAVRKPLFLSQDARAVHNGQVSRSATCQRGCIAKDTAAL